MVNMETQTGFDRAQQNTNSSDLEGPGLDRLPTPEGDSNSSQTKRDVTLVVTEPQVTEKSTRIELSGSEAQIQKEDDLILVIPSMSTYTTNQAMPNGRHSIDSTANNDESKESIKHITFIGPEGKSWLFPSHRCRTWNVR